MALFNGREQAGKKLAEHFRYIAPQLHDPIILGIPRGGIPIGAALAEELGCPLDVIVLRKLPIPSDPEAGFGAVTLDKVTTFNEPLRSYLNLPHEMVDNIIETVYEEVLRRNDQYRQGRPHPILEDRTVIITDDGLASGYTMLAAVKYARRKGADQVVASAPVAHGNAYELLRRHADRVEFLHIDTAAVFAVASFYEEFPEMNDEQVMDLLEKKFRSQHS
ncbi:MAG: phosphoribosyltransferase [Chitinivibrionales bacterium]